MKTSELTGKALDLVVAKLIYPDIGNTVPFHPDGSDFSPSLKWAHGGPIIEREKISIVTSPDDANAWIASIFEPEWKFNHIGPTPLIAAMRSFVASKLGDEVDVQHGLAALETFNAWRTILQPDKTNA